MADSSEPEGTREGNQVTFVSWPAALFRPEHKVLFLHNTILRYAFALAMVGLAILLRYAMTPLLGPGLQFITVFPIVVVVAIFAGRWPAILSAALGSLLAEYLFSAQFDIGVLSGAALVVLTAAVAGRLVERLHAALDKSQQDADALAQSEQRIRQRATIDEAIMASMGEGLFTLDADGLVTYVNPAAERIFGFSSAELMGRQMHDLIHYRHPDGTPFPAEDCPSLQVLYQGKMLINHEDVFIRKSGEFFPVIYSSAPILLDGKRSGLVVVFRDVTVSKQAQTELAESKQRFELFMQHLPGGAFMKDLQGKYIYANPQLGRTFGKRVEDILGKTDADILPAETALHFQENDRRALNEGSIETVERLRQPDGLEHHSIVSKFSVPDPHGKPPYIGGVAFDVTEWKRIEDALRESEQRFRTMADNISQLAWMADEKGSFFWLNKRACEYTGGTFESLQGSAWQKRVHSSQLEHLIEKSNECIRNGVFFEDTVLVRGKDGDYRWFLCRAIPIHDEEGRVFRWFGTATDIHELKQTQQALQESEEKFRMLAENAGAIIGIMQDERIIYANPFAEIASGYTRQELYALDIPKLIHPDYQKMMMERARERQAGEPIESHYEFIMVRKNGEYRWLDFSPIMIYYRGKPAIIGMAFDVTERKRAEEALRESEETFRLLAESARAVIGIVQQERFMYVNPYLETLSEYTRNELLQMPIAQLIHSDSRAQVLDRARRRQAGEQVETHYEFAMLTKLGRKIWLDLSVTAIHYHGQPAVVGIAIDITGRKSFEQDLQNYKNQLESKNSELESIIGIVSHDLRAPLVNIQGFSNELQTDCGTVDTLLSHVPVDAPLERQLDKLLHHNIPESIEYIMTSAEAMNKLIASLVEVARSGLTPSKPEKIDMNVLIRQVLKSIEIKTKQAGVSYDIEDVPDCIADRTQIEQIFRNLLDNAVKYLDPARPGRICIAGKREAGWILYWIADNGIGISPEQQEKIFEPYYQLREKASGGVGMGLATVKRLVERNSGKIRVVSEKGKGSTFYVELPERTAGA